MIVIGLILLGIGVIVLVIWEVELNFMLFIKCVLLGFFLGVLMWLVFILIIYVFGFI